jgi:DNA (cytosine-5)-methyltransferase 1
VLTVGSLFSGIGGFDLGLERAGMKVIWQSEIDPFATKVLAKHWPGVPNHGDIKRINWGDIVSPDVICGGYPCQPFSTAGKRRGEEDPRHLWPWVLESISRLRPKYAILENVRGHLSMGGVTVVGELANLGYRSEWRLISAASVGANHRRDRVIIVAYPDSSPGELSLEQQIQEPDSHGHGSDLANAYSKRLLEVSSEVFTAERRQSALGGLTLGRWWQSEPNVGRMADGVPGRVDRLRTLGNAVVPQVAEVVGRLVMSHASST